MNTMDLLEHAPTEAAQCRHDTACSGDPTPHSNPRSAPSYSTVTVRDTAVTPDGRLWLRAEMRSSAVPERDAFGSGAAGCEARRAGTPLSGTARDARHPEPVDGWLLLADVTLASDGHAGPALDVKSPGRAVA